MKKVFLFLSVLVGFAATASAQRPPAYPDSLGRYSDRILMGEMEARGYYCSPGSAGRSEVRVLNVTCDAYTKMHLELYDQSGNKFKSVEYFMSSSSKCQSERSRILAETANGRLYQDTTIAFCDPYTNVIKVKFSDRSITETEKTFSSSESACSQNANQFNKMF